VFQQEEFLKLKTTSVCKIVSQNELAVKSEFDIIIACTRWCEHQITHITTPANITQNDFLEIAKPIKEHLRMALLSVDEFLVLSDDSNCLYSEEEKLGVLKFLCSPSKYKLPEVFSMENTPRHK
jgi:hypothetical protein